MFLLNNIHSRDYAKIYSAIPDVVFDVSDEQLKSSKNAAWSSISAGSIVCVVGKSRKVSTFHRIERCVRTDVPDDCGGYQHVIVGTVVGKLLKDQDMTSLLNRFGVRHQYLPGNKLSIGLNVADLGNALALLELNTKDGVRNIGQLEASVSA